MSRYTKIERRIWNDEKFRSLSDNAKLVFFFLLTHPHLTPFGAIRTSISGLASELGWTLKGFAEPFQEGIAKGMVKVDEAACLVVLPNYIRHNPPENPNVVRSWIKTAELLPECCLLYETLHSFKGYAKGLGKGFAEAFPEPWPKGMPNGMPNQEAGIRKQEQDIKTKKETECAAESDGEDEPFFPQKQEKIPFKEIVGQLNLKAGVNFGHNTDATRKAIRSLWKQGFRLDDFFTVINHKSSEWVADPKMSQYLRPQTLFSTKFESYLQSARKNGNGHGSQHPPQDFTPKFTYAGDTSIFEAD